MITINYTRLRMSGALNIEHLTALKLHIGVNTHGWAVVEGEAGENALEQLSGALAGREQHILTLDESGAEKCLFAGVIREAELVRVGGYNRFHVELLSGTCLMDREVRSRSFQDVGRTYSQVAQQVCSEYSGGAAICTVGEDKTLGQPVIQYRETDWEFLMRMASHCGGVLVPETHRGLPRMWFGFPDRSFTCEFPEDAYTSGISQRYYELGGSAAGYSKADFFYYDVESPQLCDLGWYTVFKGQPFIISEKYAILERGELIFTYRLGRLGLGWGKMLYNEKISGMTLLGEVLETSRETLKLKLDIDSGWNPGGPYPYTWRPETGNFMYCMPQVGTQVSLYCPNYDEKTAIAVNCVRTNGGDCDRMSDPAKRSFVTEHGKEMNLYPGEMSLIGGSNGLCNLSDEDGITIGSEKPVVIIASEEVKFEAAQVVTQALVGEIVAAKGNPVTGDVDSGLVVCNNYDAVAQNITGAEGWNCVAYGPYNDAPEESSFDVGALVGNVLAGIAVAAAVGLFVAASILFFPALIAAATGTATATGTLMAAGAIGGITAVAGAAAAIGTGIEDVKNGEVRDTSVYVRNAYNVATTTGGILQTVYGLYNLAKLIHSLPDIVKGIGDFVKTFRFTIPGPPPPPFVLVEGPPMAASNPIEITVTLGVSLDQIRELLQIYGVTIFNTSNLPGSSSSSTSQGSGRPTEPTGEKGGKPQGKYASEKEKGLQRQNQAADKLADEGYRVEMLQEIDGGNGYGIKEGSNPDFLIEGKVFDCYSPDGDTIIKNIIRTISKKTRTQATNIILNLEGLSPETVDNIYNSIIDALSGDLKHLTELKVIWSDTVLTWVVR